MDVSSITLELPALSHIPSYLEALEEGFVRGAQAERKSHIPLVLEDAAGYLASLNDPAPGVVTAPNGEEFEPVPYENLWLVEGDTFIGEFSFRLNLNAYLESYGGHVGYGIRPSMMGKGLATLGLKLLRNHAAGLGIDQLLITCDAEHGGASERVIQKNGGVLYDINEFPYGHDYSVKRYWVPTAI